MAIFNIPCGHIDFPACGCNEVAYTGEDAIERAREDDDAQDILDRDDDDGHDCEPDDSMDGDFDSAMVSAGFGMDEDYRCDMLCEGYDEY